MMIMLTNTNKLKKRLIKYLEKLKPLGLQISVPFLKYIKKSKRKTTRKTIRAVKSKVLNNNKVKGVLKSVLKYVGKYFSKW